MASGSTSTSRGCRLREEGLEPFEIMVSESQERMLCVVAPERVGQVIEVCERWETLATPIGSVTDSGYGARARRREPSSASSRSRCWSTRALCTTWSRFRRRTMRRCTARPSRVLAGEESPGETLLALLRSPNIASRRPVFEQYDWIVQSRTVRRPEEADAAVLTLPDGGAIGVSIDGNGRRVACDPRAGAAEAVYECSANLACVGAEPLGLTNCLNFGNPEKPHVAWQLVEAVEGLAEACEALGVPVVGGNVSLYNEAPERPDLPDAGRGDGRRGCPTRREPGGSGSHARATRSRWWAVEPHRWPAPSWPSSGGQAPAGPLPPIEAGGRP